METGLLSAGHSVSPWVTDYRIDSLFPPYDISNLQQGFEVQTYEFNLSNGVSPSQPVRTVGGVWKGWTTGAQFAANQGYGMDYSYASQGSWLKQSNGKWARGYVNGSGRPMKFISITGTVLPVYQQGTDLIDEQLMEGLIPSSESLGISAAIDASRQQIDASVSSNYGAVVAETQMTTYRFNGGFVAAWFEGTLDYAVSKGLPILTGQQWWVFNNIRDNAHYTQINWNDAAGKLTFNQEVTTNITSTAGVSLTTLLPVIYKNRSLRTVFVDGVNTPFSIDNLKTTNMIWVTVSAGPHTFEATYQTDAAIGNLAATVASDMPRFLYQPVRFDASVDAGTQVTYLWDFGDGGIGSGPNPMHVYRQFGTGVYTVSVTATNAAGSRFGTVPVTLTLPAVSYMPIVQK